MKDIEKIIKETNEENVDNVDWSKVWGQKYSILNTYSNEVDVVKYKEKIRCLLDNLKEEYNYNELDAMLVLKDILYHEWKDKK